MSERMMRRDFLKAASAAMVFGAFSSSFNAQTKELNCAFIGVGGRGTDLLRETLRLPNIRVVAICDINAQNRERAVAIVQEAQKHRPEALGDKGVFHYRELLARKDIDCLVISTPCNWHATMYIDAMNANKHFYGEKPIAITMNEIRAILEARKKNPKVVVQIGFQWGAHRGRADVVKRVHEGEIGELLEGRFYRYNNWVSLGRWFNKRELSGDWMLEQAVHEFNLIWWVTKTNPIAVYAVGRRNVIEPQNPERNVTDYYTAVIEYPNGLIVHYSHGWISPQGFTGIATHFIGTKGAVDILGAYIVLRDKGERIYGQGQPGDTFEHLQNFFEAVRAGDPKAVYCGVENGVAASYVGLLIRLSIDKGRRVTFEDLMQLDDGWSPLVPTY
ncbi:MAG: Gfo/Idh/MocA family oxidoreductase [Armatimonadetes bacterium]|nr:Gfo/Idh/MocA family oxidoreductase [Armatimonadota bacterium]